MQFFGFGSENDVVDKAKHLIALRHMLLAVRIIKRANMQRVITDGLVVNPIGTTVYKNEPKLVPVERRCQSFSRTLML